MIEVQDVTLDPQSQRVWRAGREIEFSRMEFALLHALMERAGELVSREELMRGVWESQFWTSTKTIDVHLGWVRRKLGDDGRRPTLIRTVRGRGLVFQVRPPVPPGGAAPGVDGSDG